MMEPIFQTETVYTYDEYKKYNQAVLWQIRKVPRTILLLELVLLAVSYFSRDMTYILAALLVPLIFKIVLGFQAKSAYQKNPRLHNVTFAYKFYENHIETVSPVGGNIVYYENVQRVLENPTNYYLILDAGQGLIFVKRNCPLELQAFIKGLGRQTV